MSQTPPQNKHVTKNKKKFFFWKNRKKKLQVLNMYIVEVLLYAKSLFLLYVDI